MVDGIEDLSYPFLKPSGFPSIPKNQVPACNFFEANESYAPCNNDGNFIVHCKYKKIYTNK